MKPLLLSFFIVLFTGWNAEGQLKIRGKVIDIKTGIAIGAISIKVDGLAKSTISNDNGEFEIKIQKLPATLRFSHINYQIKKLNLDTANYLKVALSPAKTLLKTVYINATSAENLLNSAWLKAGNTLGLHYNAKAFYRQLTTVNDTAQEIHELFYDLKWNVNKIEGWRAKQSRYAKLDSNKDIPVGNQSYLSFLFSGYLYNFNNASYPDKHSIKKTYVVKIDRYIEQADQDIAVVSCTLKADRRNTSNLFVDANYYIGTKDHKIYKVESTVYNVPVAQSAYKGQLHTIATFATQKFPVPVLDNLITELYLRYQKNKIAKDIHIKSLVAVYDAAPQLIDSDQVFNRTSEFVIDMNVIRRTPYSQAFWLNNTVVARTPLENNFISLMENRDTFGNIVKPAPVAQQQDLKKMFFEKIYLHTDREHYAAGEDIWFKAYLVNAQNNLLFNSSNNLYVDLLDSEGKIVQHEVIRLNNGIGHGDLKLNDSTAAGTFRLKTYTNWMLNFGDRFIFEKQIQVHSNINKLAAKVRPITELKNHALATASNPVSNNTLRFYPEGGSMIEGAPGIVAVKAEDAGGKGIGTKGSIYSSRGERITDYDVNASGMGVIMLKPSPNETYFAKGSYTDGEAYTIQLPRPMLKGVSLNVRNTDSLLRVIVSTNDLTLRELQNKELLLLCRSKNKTYLRKMISIKGLETSFNLSKTNFPSGISNITLYDRTGKPQCERLFYHENTERETIVLTTDKANYQPKGKVTVNIKVIDRNKQPVKAQLSLSATDAAIIPDNESNISAYFNLQSEIKGNIENPSQYFNENNPTRKQQLDLLLLTQGWRDYTWKRLADSALRITHLVEQGITISGNVKQISSNKPIVGSNVTLFAPMLKGNRLLSDRTDSTGSYYFDGLEFYGSQRIKLNSRNNKGEKLGQITLDSLFQQHMWPETTNRKSAALIDTLLKKDELISRSINQHLSDTVKLDEVTIRRSKTIKLFDQTVTSFGYKDEIFNIDPKDYDHANLRHYLQHYSNASVGEVTINEIQYSLLYYPGPKGTKIFPRMIINNKEAPFTESEWDLPIMVDYQYIYLSVPVENVQKVIIKHVLGATHMNFRGAGYSSINNILTQDISTMTPISDMYIMYITLKPGALGRLKKDQYTEKDIISEDVNGYYEARTFYTPKVENTVSKPDLRTTIYWQPNITTNQNGEASISYNNADPKTNIRIVVEGVTENGQPVTATTQYQIK